MVLLVLLIMQYIKYNGKLVMRMMILVLMDKYCNIFQLQVILLISKHIYINTKHVGNGTDHNNDGNVWKYQL